MAEEVAGSAGQSREKGRFAVTHLPGYWYILCRADELTSRPVSRTLWNTPLVLFRDASGRPRALLDRCAHRNVPLSAGKNRSGLLECAYHGWRFDGEGLCRLVPALSGPQEGRARRVPSYAACEQQGYVWVWGEPDTEPTGEPFRFPCLDDSRYLTIRYDTRIESSIYNTVENALDVPHTAFLHKGLFRGGKQNRIEVVVRRFGDRVEAEYLGEPRPSGIIGRLLAPGGGTVTHFDRFLLPSLAQVEYALGADSHLLICDFLTPVSELVTHMYAVASVRLPFGIKLAQRLLTPLAKRVVQQDADILRLQSQTTKRLGGEQFVSTEVDVLGPHILRLLKQAERGEVTAGGEPKESRSLLLA